MEPEPAKPRAAQLPMTSHVQRGTLAGMHDMKRILSAIDQSRQRHGTVQAAGLRRTALPTFFASAVDVVVRDNAFR